MALPDPVFRFAIMRAPRPPRVSLAIDLSAGLDLTDLANDLRTLRNGAVQDRAAMAARAQRFVIGPVFVAHPDRLPLARDVRAFDRALGAAGPLDTAGAARLAESVFGRAPSAVVQSGPYRASRHAAVDAILALSIVEHPARRNIAGFERHLRVLDLVRLVAEGGQELTGRTVDELMRVPLQLPGEIFPLPPRVRTAESSPPSPAPGGDADGLKARLAGVEQTIAEVLAVRSFERRPGPAQVVVDRRARDRLSPNTKSVIAGLGIDLEQEPFIPATIAATLPPGLAPAGRSGRTRASTSPARSTRSASRITGTSPAHDTTGPMR